jgi:hypothetical protein
MHAILLSGKSVFVLRESIVCVLIGSRDQAFSISTSSMLFARVEKSKRVPGRRRERKLRSESG